MVGAFILATTSLAYIFFYSPPPSFDFTGKCLGTIIKKESTYALVYTLRDLNIPGERFGGYTRVIATPEALKEINKQGLLHWIDADVNIHIRGHNYIVRAFVLPERNVGDEVVLDCSISVSRGLVVNFFGVEVLTSTQPS